MERYLKCGVELNIQGKGKFEIKKIIGQGASCVVYLAEYTDANGICTEHLIKEYNPQNMELYREETGELCLGSEEDREAYEQGLIRFEEGYKKQLLVRREISGLKNVTSNIQEIYYANGTQYIDMTCNEGVSYEKMQEMSLFDLLRRMKGLAKIIGNYHKAGLLHLDIKPQNIFAIPETAEMVLLFDFDSVVNKEEVTNSKILSYTQSWAAPEQLRGQRNLIGEATDIFAIGEILFFKIFERHSETEERRSFAEYAFDREAELFKNVNPKVFGVLEDILHKTICRTVKERYQSAEEMLEILDEAIKLADPKEPYLKTNLPAIQNFFVGRDSEIEEIHQRLNENNVLFVSGVGGIGKSELVKNYAKKYREEYDTVIFAPFVSSILSMVVDDKAVPVYNFSSYEDERMEDYYERKLAKVKELSSEQTLFIIDNVDTEDDKLQDVLGLGCKVIITTRRDFSEYGYEQLEVNVLNHRADIISVFDTYYSKTLSEKDKEKVEQIIDLVDGHTMTVELLAKQMMAGRVTPVRMLEKLQVGMQNVGREKVKSGKEGVFEKRSAYEHIRALFDLSSLSEGEKYVLGNLSLLPHTGVPTELFYSWCELEDYDAINELVTSGWVRIEKETDYISLHPVVAEVVMGLVKEHPKLSDCMIDGLINFIDGGKRILDSGMTMEWADNLCFFIKKHLVSKEIESKEIATFFARICMKYLQYGKIEDAFLCGEKALAIRKKISDIENGAIAAAYADLGSIYRCTNEYDKAEEYYHKALSMYESEYSENDIRIARMNWLLGRLKERRKEFREALENYENAIKIVVSKKEDFECLFGVCADAGIVCVEQGSYEEAEKYLNIALEYIEDKDAELYIDSKINLFQFAARLYRYKHEFNKAEEYCHAFYELTEILYGNTSIKMGRILVDMAEYYQGVRDYEKAEEDYRKALEIYLNFYSSSDKVIGILYYRLAQVLFGRKLYSEAKKYYMRAWDIFEKLSGDYTVEIGKITRVLKKIALWEEKYK